MNWYTVNAILYFRFKDGVQEVYTVWENIYLIEASSFAEARVKGTAAAKETEGDSSGSLTSDDRPCEMVFLGIRKITTCVDEDLRPDDGTELTYNEFQLTDWESLQRLSRGLPTALTYEAIDYEEESAETENGTVMND